MEIGKTLRKAREARGLSMEDVARLTRINLKYIKAIENDSFDALPGGVYTRGFLRSYARLLGLDPGELLSGFEEQNPVEINDLSEKHTPAAFNFPPKESLSAKKLKKTACYIAFAVIIILAGYLVWAGYTHIVKSNGSGREDIKPSNLIERLKGNQQEKTTEANQEGLNIVLDVTGDECWMRVAPDGVTKFTGTVAAGNSIGFQASERMYIKLGNAGAVEVTVNGRVIGPLGKKGEVIEKEFTVQK
ncbi:MAG: RodZ domain-containing protein [Eubacteriales bacterium]